MRFVGTVGRRLGQLHEALARPSEDPAFTPVEADAAAVVAWKAGIGAQVTGALDALAAQSSRLEPASRAMAMWRSAGARPCSTPSTVWPRPGPAR